MPPSPYGNPFHNAAVPLVVGGKQLYYPRNVTQRQLPPNMFNQALDCEAGVWREILRLGGMEKICPQLGVNYPDPPWVKQPPQARGLRKIGSIALPGPPFGVDTVVTSFIVPLGWDGVIISTVNEFTGNNFIEGSGDISWRLQINQRYVKDMGNLQTTLGSMTQPWTVNSGSIRIQSRQLVQWIVNIANANPANGRIICAMFGWFYPRYTGTRTSPL